jgi:hypothetical protein
MNIFRLRFSKSSTQNQETVFSKWTKIYVALSVIKIQIDRHENFCKWKPLYQDYSAKNVSMMDYTELFELTVKSADKLRKYA